MKRSLVRTAQVIRAFGLRSLCFRAGHELQQQAGVTSLLLRTRRGWDAWHPDRLAPGHSLADMLAFRRDGRPPFFLHGHSPAAPLSGIPGLDAEGIRRAVAEGEAILGGKLPFFGSLGVRTGFPPEWWTNHVTGETVSPTRDWTRLRFHDPGFGDLKFILEPSRFLWVYPLARAYVLSGEERFAEAFWVALESWMEGNPALIGPLWVCGQESALRLLACTFALYAFIDAEATTQERLGRLLSFVGAHAWRIERTLLYARSQRNNHLLSEAVGLWTAGALFPEMPFSGRWRSVGLRLFREGVLDQFHESGVYSQYSFNYQRLAVQLCSWMLELGALHGIEWDGEIRERIAASVRFLCSVTDETGWTPNSGPNDGAILLPLSACDFRDYRPALQSASRVLGLAVPFPPGPWDEESIWLSGVPLRPRSAGWTCPPPDPASGFYRLGAGESWAMIRCARYDRRPAQADQLHVDLWWKGINIARDPGTYIYNGEPPWDNGLARTPVHNTVTVDATDQMVRAGRFLWVRWSQGNVRALEEVEESGYFEGEHDGYRELGVVHRRAVSRLRESGWIIVDDVLGRGDRRASLHWLLPDLPCFSAPADQWHAVQSTPAGEVRWRIWSSAPAPRHDVIRGGESLRSPGPDAAATSIRGWESATYGALAPALSLVCDAGSALPLRFVTLVSLHADDRADLDPARGGVVRLGGIEWRVALAPLARGLESPDRMITVERADRPLGGRSSGPGACAPGSSPPGV